MQPQKAGRFIKSVCIQTCPEKGILRTQGDKISRKVPRTTRLAANGYGDKTCASRLRNPFFKAFFSPQPLAPSLHHPITLQDYGVGFFFRQIQTQISTTRLRTVPSDDQNSVQRVKNPTTALKNTSRRF